MIDVSCAIIRNEEKQVLVVQRGGNSDHPYKWEFPGGKVEPGETSEDSVIREVREELGMSIVIITPLGDVEHDYGFRKVRLIPFVCDTLNEKPVLREHIAYRWLQASVLRDFDLAEADIVVAEKYLKGESNATASPETSVPGPSPVQSTGPVVSDDELKAMISGISGAGEIGWIAASAEANSHLLHKLIEFSEGTDDRLVFRSSWALTRLCELNPQVLIPFLPTIVVMLLNTVNPRAQRSFLKILQLTGTATIEESLSGRLVDHCFSLLRSASSAIAVKAYSMDVLVEIVQRYPDLTNELIAVLKLMPDDIPAGIISKKRSVLRRLDSPTAT